MTTIRTVPTTETYDIDDLGVRLHRGEPSAYSHWCVETTQDEVDVGAVVEQAGITTETDLDALAASTNVHANRTTRSFLRDAIAEDLAEEGR